MAHKTTGGNGAESEACVRGPQTPNPREKKMAETQTTVETEGRKTVTRIGARNGVEFVRIDGTVKVAKDKEEALSYEVPASFADLVKLAASLPDTDPDGAVGTLRSKEDLYKRWLYAVDLRERAAMRESKAAESTIIRVEGKEVDIMALPVDKAIALVNFTYMRATMLGASKVERAWTVARTRLLESGAAVEDKGMLVPVKNGAKK